MIQQNRALPTVTLIFEGSPNLPTTNIDVFTMLIELNYPMVQMIMVQMIMVFQI